MAKAYLEPNEIHMLEKAATNLKDCLLIRVLFHVGCRISEALSREVKDVDFERANITIEHLKLRIQINCPQCGARLAKSYSFCPKCSERVEEAVAKEQEHRKVRTLPVDLGTLAMLKHYVDAGGPVLRDGKTLIFGINSKLVNPETGKTHYVSPHRLRDAFAIHAVKLNDSGDGLRLLQEHLGHASFDTTAKYRKVAGEELKDWYEKLWNNEVKHDDEGT